MRGTARMSSGLLRIVIGASILVIFVSFDLVYKKLTQWRRLICTGCDSVVSTEDKINACADRFSTPWFPGNVVRHTNPDLNESNFRAFVSTLPSAMNDGFGHKAKIIAWELASARLLNVTYIHRVSSYASLTAGSGGVDIIEDFFNWRQEALERTDFFKTFCVNITASWDLCGARREHCADVIQGAGFSRIVKVGGDMLRCAMQSHREHHANRTDRCGLRAFLSQHSNPGMLFELDDNRCWYSGLFKGKWEDAERSRLLNFWSARKHPFPLDSHRIHIAVHIRRGDVLTKNSTRHFVSTDRAFVAAISKVIRAISDFEHPRRPQFEVHIFSQGKPHAQNIWSRHDIALYSDDYANERGEVQSRDYWPPILRASLGEMVSGVIVTMRLSQDTLRSIATMASADVFIASRSQLATDLVSPISRGVQLLPELVNASDTSIPWDSKEIKDDTFCGDCFREA